MSTNSVEVQGTLQPDGTLVLDDKLNLPPGRVRVRVQPQLDPTQTPVWQNLEKIWADLEASGHVPRTKEEIDAELAAARQEDEGRMQQLEQIHEECERSRREREGSP